MTRRYQTSGRFELKLPMAVIESCWLMNVNSELSLTGFSSESVRLNIILQKTKEHVKLFFSATDNLPYFEVGSDHYKCSVETVLENGSATDGTGSSYASAYRTQPTAHEDGYERGRRRREKPAADARLRPVQTTRETEEFVQEVNANHVKEECDENDLIEDQTDIDPSQMSHVVKAEESGDRNDDPDDHLENNRYDSDSDTISFTYEDVKDEQIDGTDAFSKALPPSRVSEPKQRGPKYTKQGACPYCGVYYGNLAQHVFSYCSKNPERIRTFHCCYCKHKVRSKEELIEHKRSHVLARDFKCEICDAGFFTRQRLIRHMRYVHLVGNNPVKIYTCGVCEKRFHYRSHYDRHITIHQEEKSVQCELCGKLFKNKHNVRNHQTRMHPMKMAITDFPYYCEKCGEGFLHLGSHRCVEARRPRLKFSRTSSSSNFQGIFSELRSEDANSSGDGFIPPSADSVPLFVP